nr:hypothetical protein [Myxococcota bacterium]
QQAARTLETARAQLAASASTYQFADEAIAGELRTRASAIESDAERARGASSPQQMREQSYDLQAAPMAAEGY